ncbi:probable G-protein coupled receptor CG31760 isoform X2 [Drosophila sechellia]|uniref:probable G-protein coupled receptor CG31760 isoform X2 n=1 Tax=Drosophila sechellia TaxID=7238 RepID=UPI0013DDEF3B|nr:probable G-protein coupled receptor CG31760 isoform X2 [Drosophila sechellia]
MKCWHNVVRRRKKKPTAAAAAEGSKEAHGGVAAPRDRDAICQRQQQVDTYTWLTTQAVPLLWLHLLLLVAFAKHAAAATTIATNPEATTTTVSNYTVTTTSLSSSTTTTSTGSAPASSSAADKFAGNWAILEDSFRNIVRIGDGNTVTRTSIEQSLVTIHDIATENLGTLCISTLYRPLQVPINSERYESSRQKTDLAASILQEVGIIRHGGLSDALAKGLLTDDFITGARILALNLTNGAVQSYVWWVKGAAAEIQRYDEDGLQIGKKPAGSYPWFDDETSSPTLRSPKFAPSPPNNYYKGWWTYPYFSCSQSRWLVSYSIAIPPIGRHGLRGFISIDIDVSTLRVNQCEAEPYPFGSRRQKMQQLQTHNRLGARRTSLLGSRMGAIDESTINDLQAFHSSHKCHRTSMVVAMTLNLSLTVDCTSGTYTFYEILSRFGGQLNYGRRRLKSTNTAQFCTS